MNTKKKLLIWLRPLAIIGLAALMSACGSSPDDDARSPSPSRNPQTPKETTGTCVPLGQPIPFSGTDNYLDYYRVVGGSLPAGDLYWDKNREGQMRVGGQSTQQGAGAFLGYGVDGQITMNVTSAQKQTQNQYYSATERVNVTGTLQLNAMAIQEITYELDYAFGHGGFQQTNHTGSQSYCVSGISMNLGYSGQHLYNGRVYLYINNTNRMVKVEF
jgi:hypothetical protein